jgi:hypothetical protein
VRTGFRVVCIRGRVLPHRSHTPLPEGGSCCGRSRWRGEPALGSCVGCASGGRWKRSRKRCVFARDGVDRPPRISGWEIAKDGHPRDTRHTGARAKVCAGPRTAEEAERNHKSDRGQGKNPFVRCVPENTASWRLVSSGQMSMSRIRAYSICIINGGGSYNAHTINI